uniref:Glycosyl transferase family 2 n=1 Tax=Cyanothece sp. (strain PCC 7425 / ATCC 29141) TaxID=395961 RepID=B8HVA1_CYAP4
MPSRQVCNDVAAIVTAMTDAEKLFIQDTLEAVLTDPGIGQVILCVSEGNNWIDGVISKFISDPRLEVLRLPLSSPGAIRNQALIKVKMPWVAYCDGDDIWCNGKTLIQRSYASITQSDFVGVDHYLVSEDGKIRALSAARYLPMPSSWMVRTDIMKQFPFNELLYQGEDGEWWIRTNGSVIKTRCPKMLIQYRLRRNSLSTTTPSKQRKLKIVTLAARPGLGVIIYVLSWCVWWLSRSNKYCWHKNWNLHPTKLEHVNISSSQSDLKS